ncbi:hypothetical protein [Staphylococcus aureus]|uniref:hypothetical protein n=1 Tax=Staphylococcus aureus TaxID=1280 RepID=UPI0026F00138|nr:hypothetical protein [Staphylococcus aureus]HCG2504402.1 hypothetical protein [Staphylococcus aureus]HCG2750312.1 hypothetical protein [Staphylococcus aureus]
MTTTTITGDTWDVYFNDRRYRNLLGDFEDLITETKSLIRQGYKTDVIKNKMDNKALSLQSKFKELGQILLDEHEEKIVEIQQKEKESSYENPQVEMLKRQDIEAKVNLIDVEELFNLVYNANPKTTNVYELNIYKKAIESRLTEDENVRLKPYFDVLVEKVIYPYRNNEEYQKLEYNYNVLRQFGLQNNGQPVIKHSDGDIEIINIQSKYNEVFRNA